MARLSRMVGAVVGSVALAAIPTVKAEAVPETENNDTFPGQAANVGDLITGNVCPTCSFPPLFPPDPIDFFNYTGLTPGDSFDLTFQAIGQLGGRTLDAGLFTDQTTVVDSVSASSSTAHLVGTVPASGALTFGIAEDTATGFEQYSIQLATSPAGVPEPATVALLAAGLTAAGLRVAGRRKRS